MQRTELCLNPFGTGQCLTTLTGLGIKNDLKVSIPLEQGNVLRRQNGFYSIFTKRSQSLWNRAMSYDLVTTIKDNGAPVVSIPLEQGNVLRQ